MRCFDPRAQIFELVRFQAQTHKDKAVSIALCERLQRILGATTAQAENAVKKSAPLLSPGSCLRVLRLAGLGTMGEPSDEMAGLGLDERLAMEGRGRGVSLVVPEDYTPGRTISVATPDGEMGEVELPKDAKPGQTLKLNMKTFDASGDEIVELVRPTPETKLGLTFGEFRAQVVIHQV